MNYRGSEWRIWDLHVHSPKSYGGEYSEFAANLSKCEADIIGINDYCSLDGYVETLKHPVGAKVLFPVVEFRMNNILVAKNDPRYSGVKINFHVIFDNDPQVVEVAKTWLGSLKCNSESGDDQYLSVLLTSLDHSKISLDYKYVLSELESNPILRDRHLIWLPYNEYGGIDEVNPDSDGPFKLGLLKKADILGSSNNKQISFFLWKDSRYTPDKIKEMLGGRKYACIKGSDAHAINYPFGRLKNAASEAIEKFCWIKADATFEGLKQIIYEPEYRVRISQTKPIDPLHKVSSIKFRFPGDLTVEGEPFCLSDIQEVKFSPNLTCLIGGRGTGKSTLLNMIDFKFNGKHQPTSILDKIVLPKGSKLENYIELDSDSKSVDIEFLRQNEIESFALNREELTKAIYNRILKLDTENLVQNRSDRLAQETKNIEDQINHLGAKKNLEERLSSANKEIEANRRIVSSINDPEYNTLREKENNLSQLISDLENSETDLLSLIESIKKIISDNPANGKINEYSESHLKILSELSGIVEGHSAHDYSEATQIKMNLKMEFDSVSTQIRDFLEKRGVSQEDLKDISNAVQKQNDLEELIKRENIQLTFLSQIISRYSPESLHDAKSEYEKELHKSITQISLSLANLGSEVKPISLKLEENVELCKELFLKRVGQFFIGTRSDHLEQCLFDTGLPKIVSQEEFLDKLGYGKNPNKTQSLIISHFQNETNFEILKLLVFRYYLDLNASRTIQVYYDGRPLEKTSFGQRCAAAIIILLLLGNNPIVIDEPEAHLDSSLIANYLVGIIKEKKQKRQIIFATHNANFVVNGDSELILILSTNDEGKTAVGATSIENIEMRPHVMKLEGSKEAFKTRGEKYDL